MKKLSVFLFSIFILTACSSSKIDSEPMSEILDSDFRVINVNAERFEFSPSVIRVRQGEKVRIIIKNTDFIHNMTIPEMSIANAHDFILDTSEKGDFEVFCSNFCGSGHQGMTARIIVE